jgi:hypothetical protein
MTFILSHLIFFSFSAFLQQIFKHFCPKQGKRRLKVVPPVNPPRQDDGINCGIFCLEVMRFHVYQFMRFLPCKLT